MTRHAEHQCDDTAYVVAAMPDECTCGPLCESGWTGDRCVFPLFHEGPHSNASLTEAHHARVRIFGEDLQ